MKSIKLTWKICNSAYILCSLYFIKKDFLTTFLVCVCSLGIKNKKHTKASESKNKGIDTEKYPLHPCKSVVNKILDSHLRNRTTTLNAEHLTELIAGPSAGILKLYSPLSCPVPVHHLLHLPAGSPVFQQLGLCGVQKLTFIWKTRLNHHSAEHRKNN